MENDIIREAQLGLEADNFKASRLGTYLYDRAEMDILDATSDLVTVDPCNSKYITELQNKIYRANSFIIWIEEAIEAGNFAVDEIRGEQ